MRTSISQEIDNQILNHSAASAPTPSYLGVSSTIEPIDTSLNIALESICGPMSADELLSVVLNKASLDEPVVDKEAIELSEHDCSCLQGQTRARW